MPTLVLREAQARKGNEGSASLCHSIATLSKFQPPAPDEEGAAASRGSCRGQVGAPPPAALDSSGRFGAR